MVEILRPRSFMSTRDPREGGALAEDVCGTAPRMGGLDDDADAVVVAAAEPVEGHVCARLMASEE
jgi:hypothetical protein